MKRDDLVLFEAGVWRILRTYQRRGCLAFDLCYVAGPKIQARIYAEGAWRSQLQTLTEMEVLAWAVK